MNTLEGNKLIAEFRNLDKPIKGYFYIPEFKEAFRLDDLKYHTSWDWLMPCVIMCKENQLFGSQHLIDRIDDALLLVDIEATYQAVLEFIQWYNTQQ